MGCWNKTCGLTQLPIYAGDKVITFIIIEAPYAENLTSPCYENSFWNVIPLPIYGEYNDYGWMEEDDGEDWKLEVLKAHFTELKRKEPYNDNGFIRYNSLKGGPFDSFEALGDCIHGGVFKVTYPANNRELNISAIMIHADAFNDMTQELYSEWDHDTPTSKETLIDDLEAYRLANPPRSAAHKENIERIQNLPKEEVTEEDLRTLFEEVKNLSDIFLGGGHTKVDKFFEERYPDVKYHYSHPAYRFISYFINPFGGSSEGFITTDFLRNCGKLLPAKEAFDGWMVSVLFMSLRRQFMPMGHELSLIHI